jgi:hypothetical protein
VQEARVDQLDLVRVEVRRGTAKGREVETSGQFVEGRGCFDRLGGSDSRQD